MIAAKINEIKKELGRKSNKELIEYCLRLSKFKKENKDLLTFLLFEADDISSYTEKVKQEIRILFEEITNTHIYYLKKSLRKILRYVNKYIRIAGSKSAEAELLIQFCINLKSLPVSLVKHKQVNKIYETQLARIETAISSLHPDLQYDLRKQLSDI